MIVDRKQVIQALEEIALLLELKGENTFKIRAYVNGARTLQGMEESPVELVGNGTLGKVKGFGEALVSKVTELVKTGKMEYQEKLRAEFPATLLDLLKLPGVGPKKVKLFYDKLGITSIEMLEKGCEDGTVAELPGCGKKTAEKILESIGRYRESSRIFLYPTVREYADQVVSDLRECPELETIEVAGSLRRFKETTKDMDLLGASSDPAPIMERFVTLPYVASVIAHGTTKSSVFLENGLQADLRIVEPGVFASALHHFTGSKEHNVAMRGRAIRRGLKLSEWGLFKTTGDEDELIPCASEEELFRELELAFIPPELRENMGEIEAAEDDALPTLVTAADYRGVLHCHSRASDGSNALEELVEHAKSLGHSYLAITDHSKSSFQANGLDADRLLAQVQEVQELQSKQKDFRFFAGVECDILTNGELDYPDEILDQLDFFIVSVHTAFTKSRDEQTARVIQAVEHPGSRILAHPTGRVLRQRDGYDIDMNKVIDACIANGVAIELNCNPLRLDMEWRRWHKAVEKGAICSINPDAHALGNFNYIELGIGFGRKGWLTPEHILNCWEVDRVQAFFAGS